MLHYDRTNKPYLTEHSGHCSCCDARFAADADLYMVPDDDYTARSDMRATVPVCAHCLTPDQHERAREIGLAIRCPGCGHCMIPCVVKAMACCQPTGSVRTCSPRVERDRAFQVLLGFVILVLPQKYASQLDVRRRVLRVPLKQVPKYRDSLIVVANRIIGKT